MRELAPNFRPRWVRLRRILFAISSFLALGFVVAAVIGFNGLSLCFLICVWGMMSVAVPMPHLPALLRLMTRPYPALAIKVEVFLERMEFDLDWDESRR